MESKRLHSPAMWDLIIFDLDGTLIDSRRDIAAGINYALAAVAGLQANEERIYPFIGSSLRGTFQAFAPKAGDSVHDEMVRIYKKYFYDHCDVHSNLFPGVLETLGQINHCPKAIATSKRTFMAKRVAEVFGLTQFMDLVQGTDEGTPLKPAPDLLLQVMEHFNVAPERTLVVGDTDHDVLAGKAAGCFTVAVTYGIRSREELESHSPDRLIDHFPEIQAIIS